MAPLTARRRRRLVLLASVAFAVHSDHASAAICALTGEPEANYNTLVASKSNPVSEAVVVSGDCQATTTIAVQSDGSLDAGKTQISRVLSVPTGATSMSTSNSGLSRGADFSLARNALKLTLSGIPSDPSQLVLPPSLQSIYFYQTADAPITSLDGVAFPASLASFTLYGSAIKSFKNVQLPASLKSLAIGNSPLTALDFPLPAALTELSFNGLRFGSIDRLALPSTLESFKMSNGGTITIRGVRWPASLQIVDIMQTTVNVFEIRRSDVDVFEKLNLFEVAVTQTACSGAAKLERITLYNLCVLSDADFDKLYGGGSGNGGGGTSGGTTSGTSPTPTTSKKPKSPGTANGVEGDTAGSSPSGGGSSSGDGTNQESSKNGVSTSPGSSEGSRGQLHESNTSGSSFSNPTDGISGGSRTGGDGASPNASRHPGRPGDPSHDAVAGSKSGSRSSVGILVIVLVSVLSVLVCVVVYRVIVNARKRRQDRDVDGDATNDKYTIGTSPMTASSDPVSKQPIGPISTEENHSIDFRDDRELMRCRIGSVTIGKRIARGGYGIVYRGSYQGRVVAIKQMLPDTWRNDSMTAAFVDEIRMSIRLSHPKIVEFIGVSWSSVRDLSAVSEFMPGGDLHAILHKYPESTGREWTRPWTTSNLRNKTLIATDVAEALVYLHSFETPIIHRDLKAKNVLLDLVGNAKLSDFGISREMTVDETMTSEVGTAAWIAPEVLRGERYGEKADIYSLGVLLVEMDRCSHPYANDPALREPTTSRSGAHGRADSSRVAHKNTQIAILVSTGKLKPTPTLACPLSVAALVTRCLSFDASERPTAVEVLHGLQRIRESQVADDGIADLERPE